VPALGDAAHAALHSSASATRDVRIGRS
jgi:hypothetical protein